MKCLFRSATQTAFVFLLAACGGGGGDSSNAPQSGFTGIEKTRSLESLTDTEVTQVCAQASSYVRGKLSTDQVCMLQATISSGVFRSGNYEANCQRLRTQCLANPNNNLDDECSVATAESRRGCTAPISLYEECLDGASDGLLNVLSDLTCSELRNVTTPAEFEQFGRTRLADVQAGSVVACRGLQRICPNAIDLKNPV